MIRIRGLRVPQSCHVIVQVFVIAKSNLKLHETDLTGLTCLEMCSRFPEVNGESSGWECCKLDSYNPCFHRDRWSVNSSMTMVVLQGNLVCLWHQPCSNPWDNHWIKLSSICLLFEKKFLSGRKDEGVLRLATVVRVSDGANGDAGEVMTLDFLLNDFHRSSPLREALNWEGNCDEERNQNCCDQGLSEQFLSWVPPHFLAFQKITKERKQIRATPMLHQISSH